MPLYEFHCSRCTRDFEELVMGGATGVKCPSCGSKRVKKLMSACAHKSGGKFVSSQGGSGCSSCSGGSCSTCGH
ncbi:MAG TPA: zinc ribbon domain-containing protein [bacterium]|nr:zinc ribbon domain-containing protein [bacterium]